MHMAGGRQCGCIAKLETEAATATKPALVSQRRWNVNGIQNVAGGGTTTSGAHGQQHEREPVAHSPNRSRMKRKKSSSSGSTNWYQCKQVGREMLLKVMHCDDSTSTYSPFPPLRESEWIFRRVLLCAGFSRRGRGDAGGRRGSWGRQQSRQATCDKPPPAATSFSMFVFVAVAVDKQTKDPPRRAHTHTHTHAQTCTATRREALQHFYIKFSFPIWRCVKISRIFRRVSPTFPPFRHSFPQPPFTHFINSSLLCSCCLPCIPGAFPAYTLSRLCFSSVSSFYHFSFNHSSSSISSSFNCKCCFGICDFANVFPSSAYARGRV